MSCQSDFLWLINDIIADIKPITFQCPEYGFALFRGVLINGSTRSLYCILNSPAGKWRHGSEWEEVQRKEFYWEYIADAVEMNIG